MPGRSHRARAAELPVTAGEKAWTPTELRQVRRDLTREIARLRSEIGHAQGEVVELFAAGADVAGDDEVDTGTKTYERDQEITLIEHSAELLGQSERALARLDAGSYGSCESCGNAIGKMRLMAASRATLCLPCKSRTERH